MRTANHWTVEVATPAGNQTVEVAANWDPEHALTNESVETAGVYQVRAADKFRVPAQAVPETVKLKDS